MNSWEAIRPYQSKDDQQILKILKEPNGYYYTKDSIDFSDYQESYVYEENGEIKGFLCMEVHKNISQIIVYVSPRSRNQGIGNKLFEYGKSRLKDLDPNTIWLFFRNDVGNTAEFFKKRGAKPWYSYHTMICDINKLDKKEFPFDKVINYDPKYFEEYLDGRARAFIKINEMIDSRPYDERERKEEIRNVVKNNEKDTWLFFKNDKLIGSIAVYGGFFDEVFVIPEYQGQRIGEAIVSWALEYSFSQGWKPILAVVTGNQPAIKLYQKSGFKIVQTLEMNRLFSANKEPDLRGPIGG